MKKPDSLDSKPRLNALFSRIPAGFLACALLTSTSYAQEVSTDLEYDANGNPTKITDGLKRATDMKYDPLQRLKQIQQPAPKAGAARPTTGFAYDGLDQLQTVTDPRNLVTRYTVDGLGKRTGLSSPDSGQTTATFNSLGAISTSTDARGVITKYDYDLDNRLTTITYGSTPYVFNYDEGQYGADHLTSMTYPAGRTDLVWDQIGRLVTKTQTTHLGANSNTFAMQYSYGKSGYGNGLLASMTYPSGNRIEYGYALPGKVTSITLIPVNGGAPVSLLRDITYRPFGPAQSWIWGNSTDTQKNTYAKSFDLSDRITSFPLGNAFNQGVMRVLAWDDGNRIRKITDTGILSPAQVTQTFDYDDLDHLTSYGDGSNVYTWQYDANGNRTQSSLNGAIYPYVIDPASNRFKGVTVNGSTSGGGGVDKAGNQKTIFNSPGFFLYGPTGRIESVYNNDLLSSANYTYNSLGERLNTGNSYYFYNEAGRLVGEYDPAGQAMEETVFLGNQPVAVLKPGANQTTSVYYVYADHLNTPRLITRAQDDKVVWRWDVAEPFGASLPNDNPNGLGQFVYNRRSPGQVFDAFLGVYYNYYRDLDPLTGRYLSVDPIGLAGGVNTYAYVLANPVSNVDTYGLQAISPTIFMTPVPPPPPPCQCPKVPPGPPGASVDKNICEAKDHYDPRWFINHMKQGGDWDYKGNTTGEARITLENFGNFNYGAVASTYGGFGLHEQITTRFAGAYQEFGTPGNYIQRYGHFWSGPPYGDRPVDQEWIARGIQYAKCKCYEK